MSTDLKLETYTTSAAQSEALGEQIGAKLKGGEVIQLVSDLGGGKTTFTRGLAKGAGSQDVVSSPTFTISKQYKGKKFVIIHFDFYRLQEAGIVSHELDEFIGDKSNVVVMEWADIVDDQLPKNRLIIEIIATAENDRRLKITVPKDLIYLIEGLI